MHFYVFKPDLLPALSHLTLTSQKRHFPHLLINEDNMDIGSLDNRDVALCKNYK